MSALRGLRQGGRHRRKPRRTRQVQNHIRGCDSLLERRDDEQVARRANTQLVEVRLSDPHPVPRADRTATADALARQRIFPRSGRVFRIYRQPAPQDTVPRHESALYGQDTMPRVQRLTPAQGGAVCPNRRAQHRRSDVDERRFADRILRLALTRRARYQDRGTHPDRDTQPSGLPVGRGAGIPYARPALVDALGRRVAAHQPLDVTGQQPRRLAIHPRRAEHRPAPARHRPPDKGAETTSRSGQHGHRRRARGGDHTCGRSYSRHRPRSRC